MKEPIKQYKPADPLPDSFSERLKLPKIKKEFPKVFKKVTCPSCSTDIGAENINLQNSLAKCGGCDVIFSIEEEVASLKPKEEVKQNFFRPEGIDLFHYKDDLEISIKQHVSGLDAWGVSLVPIFALAAVFLYFVEGIAFYYPFVTTLVSLYFIVKAFLYRKYFTYIDINDRFLSIKSSPKNLKKDKSIPVEDIDQIYLKHSGDGIGIALYMVINDPKGQQHQKLLSVKNLSKAKYLEQEIERYLGIEDRKVLEATIQ